MDKGAILGIKDSITKKVRVDVWDTDVYLRQLSALERAKLHDETINLQESEKESDQVQLMATALTYFLSDENGKRLFNSDEWESIADKSTDAIRTLFVEGMKLSTMGNAAKEEAKKK